MKVEDAHAKRAPGKLRFGVLQLPNLGWNEMVRRFLYLEQLGFDMAGTGDHFVNWANPKDNWFEIWTLLSAIAVKTERMRLGTWVTQVPFRNPALLARQVITVDHISNGRLELGLGAGVQGYPDYMMTGIPDYGARERVARFREYVEIVDRLLSNESTTYDGNYYKIKEAIVNPRAVQKPRPPITIAALGPSMLRVAARHADTWNSFSWGNTFEERLLDIRKRNRLVDKYCSEIGRDPSSLRRSYLMLDPNARKSGGVISYYESDNVFRERVKQYMGVGITEFILYYPYREDQLSTFEKIAREVIPELRSQSKTMAELSVSA